MNTATSSPDVCNSTLDEATQKTIDQLWRQAEDAIRFKGRVKEAVACVMKIIKLDPKQFKAHRFLGHLYSNLKQYDKARMYYEQALQLNPTDSKLNSYLASVYTDMSMNSHALKRFEYLLVLQDPELMEFAHIGIARIRMKEGNYFRAREQLLACLERNDKNATAIFLTIRILLDVHEVKVAHELLVELLKLEAPKDLDLHELAGDVFTAMEQYDSAEQEYMTSLKDFPAPSVSRHIKIAHLFMHHKRDFAAAINHFKLAQKLDRLNEEAMAGLRECDRFLKDRKEVETLGALPASSEVATAAPALALPSLEVSLLAVQDAPQGCEIKATETESGAFWSLEEVDSWVQTLGSE